MLSKTKDGRLWSMGLLGECVYFIYGSEKYAFHKDFEQAYSITWATGQPSHVIISYKPITRADLSPVMQRHYDVMYRGETHVL